MTSGAFSCDAYYRWPAACPHQGTWHTKVAVISQLVIKPSRRRKVLLREKCRRSARFWHGKPINRGCHISGVLCGAGRWRYKGHGVGCCHEQFPGASDGHHQRRPIHVCPPQRIADNSQLFAEDQANDDVGQDDPGSDCEHVRLLWLRTAYNKTNAVPRLLALEIFVRRDNKGRGRRRALRYYGVLVW